MGLDSLLARIERRAADTPDTPCNPIGVSAKPLPLQACTLDTPDTPSIGDACNDAGNTGSHGAGIEQAAGAASFGWLLHFTEREPMPCYCTPAATYAEVLALHPGAVAAEPIPPTAGRAATEAEAAELRELVAVVYANDTDADRAEALAAALADPVGALACYGDLAIRRGLRVLAGVRKCGDETARPSTNFRPPMGVIMTPGPGGDRNVCDS